MYVGRTNYSRHSWSATMGDHVVYERLLEQSSLWLADFVPDVVALATQPMRLRGPDGSRVRKRIPDFMCLTAAGSVRVVDVKPARMLSMPEVEASLNRTEASCASPGWAYEVWTGPNPVALRNVRWIAAAHMPHVPACLDAPTAVVLCEGAVRSLSSKSVCADRDARHRGWRSLALSGQVGSY